MYNNLLYNKMITVSLNVPTADLGNNSINKKECTHGSLLILILTFTYPVGLHILSCNRENVHVQYRILSISSLEHRNTEYEEMTCTGHYATKQYCIHTISLRGQCGAHRRLTMRELGML